MKTVKEIIDMNHQLSNEAINLINAYDYYAEYIEDLNQYTNAMNRNREIVKQLNKLGVKTK